MPSGSTSNARVRTAIAFIFLFVSIIVLSVGAYSVAHLSNLQEGIAAREGQTELQGITDPEQIDEALRRHPTNKFLQLMTMATKAARETRAATEKLSGEIEPPALSKDINLGTASRSDLEALRSALRAAEANAATFLPRYVGLFKTERDKMENYALSLRFEKDTVRFYLEGVDKRHSKTLAFTSRMLSGRADYYRAYENYVAVLAVEFGSYKVVNGQFIFPFQRAADRYNTAVNAMTAAAKRVAELEKERKTLTPSQQEEWEQLVNRK
jgi:rubrerythrin